MYVMEKRVHGVRDTHTRDGGGEVHLTCFGQAGVRVANSNGGVNTTLQDSHLRGIRPMQREKKTPLNGIGSERPIARRLCRRQRPASSERRQPSLELLSWPFRIEAVAGLSSFLHSSVTRRSILWTRGLVPLVLALNARSIVQGSSRPIGPTASNAPLLRLFSLFCW